MHNDEVATGTIYSLETGDEKVNMGMRHVGLQGRNKAVYAYQLQLLLGRESLSAMSKEDYESYET